MPKTSKKPTRSKLVKKLDVVFSQYIRVKDADRNGMVKCVTCSKVGHWKTGGMQCGHFISRKHYSTRWDERNVGVQCGGCNIYKSGNVYLFSKYLGENLSEELYQKSLVITKFTSDELQDMIDHYSNKLKKIL